MRTILTWTLLVVTACGSHDAPSHPSARPTVTPEPHTPSTTPPTSPPPPSREAPLADEHRVLPSPEAETPPHTTVTWAVVPLADESAGLPTTTVSAGGVSADVPDYPSAALDHQLALRVRAELVGSPSYGSLDGNCECTVARPNLVSFYCEETLETSRGDGDAEASAITYRLDGDTVHYVDPADAFYPGADLDAAMREACKLQSGVSDDADGPQDDGTCESGEVAVALGTTGLVGAVYYGETLTPVHIPYGDLRRLARRDGPLAAIPGALAVEPDEDAAVLLRAATPAGGDARQPGRYCALTGTIGWADLLWAYDRATAASHAPGVPAGAAIGFLSVTGGNAQLVLESDCVGDPTQRIAAALGTTPVARDWDRLSFGGIGHVALRHETSLRASPGGPVQRVLPVGTRLRNFGGEVDGHDSITTPVRGLYAYVVASPGNVGWVSARELGEVSFDAAPDPRSSFLAAAPAAVRDELARDAVVTTTLLTSGERVSLVLARSAATSSTYAAIYDAHGTPVVTAHLDVVATAARVVVTERSAPQPLLALVGSPAGDAPGIERWSFFAHGAAAPMLVLSLATGSATPSRARVRVETPHAPAHGAWAPLAVVGPGRAQTLYAWNGSALVAPTPAVPAP